MRPSIKHFVNYTLPYAIILIGIFSVSAFPVLRFPIIYILENTTLMWFFSFFILTIFFFSIRYFFDTINKKDIKVITFYLIWTAICILRGMFVAESYWDWKGFYFYLH